MFDNTRSQFFDTHISSFGDVETALRGLYDMFNCCLVQHIGRTELQNTALDTAGPNGSTLTVDQFNDGTNRQIPTNSSTGPPTSRSGTLNGPHALYVRSGTSRFHKHVYFEDNVFYAVPPTVMFQGTATAKWAAGTPPTVAVSHATLGAITVRLQDTDTADPNIRIGDPVRFAKAEDGRYYAFDSCLDGKIGDVKWWLGTNGNIPPGWRKLDSTGTYNATDRFIRCIDSGYSNMGATGGADTHTHPFSGTTSSSGAHSHTVNAHTHSISSDGSHTHGGYDGYATTDITIPSHTGNTDYATTGITWPVAPTISGNTANTTVTVVANAAGLVFSTTNFTLGGVSGPGYSGVTTDSHGHTLTNGTHNHSATGLTSSLADPEPGSGATKGHRHALPTLTHSVTEPNSGSGHRHAISSDGSHTHGAATGSATPATDTQGSHTHTYSGTTGSGDNVPSYLVLALIERFE